MRDGTWMNAERLRAYGLGYVLAALAAIGSALPYILGWRDAPPADIDYLSFHAASALAQAGEAASVWNRDLHAAVQTALQGRPGRYYAFFYPPFYLLVCLPLALLPLLPGLFAWLAATGAACWAALRRWGGFDRPILVLLAVLSPASVLNMLHGQNGYLTTALLAAAGLWIDRRPGWAGAALATLAFKPQLGLLVLPVLVATRRWAVLGWAALAGLGWVAATLLILGPAVWPAFLARLPDAGAALASGALDMWKLQSVLAMAATLGLPRGLAGALQAVVTVGVIAVTAWALRRRPGGRAEMAAIAAGAPLVTPFVLSYDLVVLLIPTAWLLAEAKQGGFRAWEKTGIALAWLLPLAGFITGTMAGVSVAAPAGGVLLALVLRRLANSRAAAS
ncbi:MAG TPA: glycosyltransferase family 87 protein [Roseomonas sp.]|nr:glycosyltransferase family 87 protein [Roseomonas sp.]